MLLAVWAEWRSCPLGCLWLPSLMCLTFHSNSRMEEHPTGAQPILHVPFCHPHCSLCSVCSTPRYYLHVCLFIHLSIPCHHHTLPACSTVSIAHIILAHLITLHLQPCTSLHLQLQTLWLLLCPTAHSFRHLFPILISDFIWNQMVCVCACARVYWLKTENHLLYFGLGVTV